ncbi:hypothetical protein ILYODFUR_031003 [Ilyodon furcidens]|uniref:Uncharacterized protein n=1 Tax=Ilyodon furcidens TaxID=33524 RepID=A0ABV0SQL3_9TELE
MLLSRLPEGRGCGSLCAGWEESFMMRRPLPLHRVEVRGGVQIWGLYVQYFSVLIFESLDYHFSLVTRFSIRLENPLFSESSGIRTLLQSAVVHVCSSCRLLVLDGFLGQKWFLCCPACHADADSVEQALHWRQHFPLEMTLSLLDSLGCHEPSTLHLNL